MLSTKAIWDGEIIVKYHMYIASIVLFYFDDKMTLKPEQIFEKPTLVIY